MKPYRFNVIVEDGYGNENCFNTFSCNFIDGMVWVEIDESEHKVFHQSKVIEITRYKNEIRDNK